MKAVAIVIAFGFLSWALVKVTIHALPAIVALATGFLAHETGAGVAGTVIVAFAAFVLTRVAGHHTMLKSRSPVLRIAVALLFAVPAVVLGYGLALALAQLDTPSPVWQQVFALSGAVIAGAAVLTQVTDPPPK
jgi:hypothetical protein